MNAFDSFFEAIAKEVFSAPNVSVRIITRRLKDLGITLTDEQLDKLLEQIRDKTASGASIEFADEQIALSTIENQAELEQALNLNIGDLDTEIALSLEDISQSLHNQIPEVVEDLAKVLLARLDEDTPKLLKEHKTIKADFEAHLRDDWGAALDSLQVLIGLSQELGGEFNETYRSTAAKSQDYVFDVLTRLHARACLISSEIHALLQAGFGDGAHARWRSLHEIAVVGIFIAEQGQDTAERYLLHDSIESYKVALLHQKYSRSLQLDSIESSEFEEIENTYQLLLDKYGRDYRHSYGWAASALGKANPNFSDLELAVEMDHLRPYYKMASHNVHANPKGILFKLGLTPSLNDLLLAGPSKFGLADPGHSTAIALQQITSILLTHYTTPDSLVACGLVSKLVDRIGDQFYETHIALEEE